MLHSSSDDDSHTNLPLRNTVNPKIVTTTITSVNNSLKAFSENKSNSNRGIEKDSIDDVDKNSGIVDITTEIPGVVNAVDETEYDEENLITKKEKKKRRRNKTLSSGLPTEIANDKTLLKYWYKRFSLFSLFDMGIKLDKGTNFISLF